MDSTGGSCLYLMIVTPFVPMKISSQVGLNNVSAESWEAVGNIFHRGVQDRGKQTGLCSSSLYSLQSSSAVTFHYDCQCYGLST